MYPETAEIYINRTPDGVLLVLGNDWVSDGRHFELSPNGWGAEVHLVGIDYDDLVATYQSYATASMAYELAAKENTLDEAKYVLEGVERECYIEPGNWTVYLLHLDRKIGRPRSAPDYQPHAYHYVGCTNDLARRMSQHKSGGSAASPLVRELVRQGGSFQVAQLYNFGHNKSGAFTEEQRLKARKDAPRYCMICKEANHV